MLPRTYLIWRQAMASATLECEYAPFLNVRRLEFPGSQSVHRFSSGTHFPQKCYHRETLF